MHLFDILNKVFQQTQLSFFSQYLRLAEAINCIIFRLKYRYQKRFLYKSISYCQKNFKLYIFNF